MDAVKFLQVKNRMCKGNDCFVCPLGNEEGGCQVGSRVNQRVTEEQLVEIVEKLEAEHPIKTRQSMKHRKWIGARLRLIRRYW